MGERLSKEQIGVRWAMIFAGLLQLISVLSPELAAFAGLALVCVAGRSLVRSWEQK